MSDDFMRRQFARDYLASDMRWRMTWTNTRKRDLERLLQAYGFALERVLDGHGSLSEIEQARDHLLRRMDYIQERAAAVVTEKRRR